MKLRRRHGAIAAAVLVLCAGFALVSTGPGALWSFLTLVALLVGLCGFVLALYLQFSIERMQGDLDRVARSLDGALRELSASNERNSRGIGVLSETIDHQIGGMLDRIETQIARPEPARAAEMGVPKDNIVALGAATKKLAGKAVEGEKLPEGWAERDLELSLEAIVSLSQGAAVGFEVHANLVLDDGAERVVRRLSSASNASELAAFEHSLVTAAMHASRRQLAGEGERLPLHAAISAALLADETAIREIASLVEIHSGLASGIVFSIPAELFATRDAAVLKGIERLSAANAKLAVEGWPTGDGAAERLTSRGVGLVKLSADRLLDRGRVRRKAMSGADLAELAERSGMTVIATDVTLDEDAVALLDLGVDLMSGSRFSPPRRLKPSSEADPALAANG